MKLQLHPTVLHRLTLRSALCAISLLAAAARADNLNKDWDNGAADNAFGNATNWNSNTLPTTGTGTDGDIVRIDQAGANKAVYSATIDNPGVGATSAQAGIFQRLRIADVSGNGELAVTGGYFATDSTTFTPIGSSGRTGTLIVNGAGAQVRLGGWMAVGHSTAGTGIVNVVNGTLVSARNNTSAMGGVTGVSIGLGNGNNARGTIVLSGGQLVTRTGVLLGTPGTTGQGRFEVRGAGLASIGTELATDDGFWVQSSGSTLAAYVDNGNLGTIYVDNLVPTAGGTYADGNVIFSPGAKLEVGFVGPTNIGAWDLMKWEGTLLTNGLSFVPGTDTNWSFAFIDTDGLNGPDTLRITYIHAGPPPPPTGLVAVPGDAQVTLRWTALAGATNYHVKRATSAGGPYSVTNDASGLSFTNTGLVNGITYYYVVTGATTNGETADSNEVRATPNTWKFVHPGVMHTQADLDRIRTKVAAGEQPWIDGYNIFAADSHSSSLYPMQGPFNFISRNPSQYLSQWENDCGAAYQNAMMWYITGNPANAAKAIAILDGWAGTCTNIIGSDARLTAGLQGHKFITAAEIIRYTGAPWSASEINTCSNFIRTVLLPQNKMYGGGNWGNIGAISEMAAGLFMEDEAEFNNAVNAIKFGAPIECDMGIVNYISPIGWTTEADRDIGHWSLGLNNAAAGAQIAWCQGVDLWTYLGNRLQVGHEYLAAYNLSNSVTYNPVQQCDGLNNGGITSDGRGRWDIPFYEQAFHPYQNLFGIASPYMEQAVAATRAAGGGGEGYDRDHVAFGTLVFALPPRTPGLPVLPSGLTGTASNGVVSLAWTSAAGALTYNVKRATSRSGPYTNIVSGFAIAAHTDMTVSNDQFYFYKVSAVNATGETADSGLVVAYPSGTAPTAPTAVVAKTISHQRIDLSWSASAGATSYNVSRATAAGGPYTNIAAGVGTAFLSYADTGLPAAATFYYVVSANNLIGEGSDSAPATATTLPALPSPWTFADAGYLTTPGNATYSGGAFTVKGAGLDYGGLYNSDAFGFAYLSLTGDGEIIARYASRQNYSQISKNGLAMRESLAGDSRHAFVYIGGDNTANFVYRTSTGGNGSASGSTNVLGSTLPRWLKLNRTGNVFTGSVSADGTNWTVINARSIAMNNTILVGFAVCSRNNGYLDTATFDNVSVTGVWPPTVSTTPVSLAPSVVGDILKLSWPADHTGWRLEAQTNSLGTGLGTNWLTVFGSSATNQIFLPIHAADGCVFFRLAYP